MAILTPGEHVLFTAQTDAIVMLVCGEPLGQRFIEWNFVSSSKDRIEQAKADWKAGRFEPVPGETEFIPLPENGPAQKADKDADAEGSKTPKYP